MRKVNTNINDIINQIKSLKGQDINLEITKGRKKTIKYSAIIENVYPSIFTVKNTLTNNSFSYSYADVLCGAVSLKEKEINQEQIV